MASRGTAVYAYRLQTQLRAYLNTMIDAIDTAANALEHASSAFDSFTTPLIPDNAIQVWTDDREAGAIRVVIVPTGSRRKRELQRQGIASGGVRLDQDHDFVTRVLVDSTQGVEGERGGWLRADRVMHGVEAVFMRYPLLDVPSLSLTDLGLFHETGDVNREPDTNEEDTRSVRLQLSHAVRAMEAGV